MRGFRLAFDIRDPVKIAKEEQSKYKYKPKQSAADLKARVNELKEKKAKDQTMKQQEAN
jgi:hypothetical protein